MCYIPRLILQVTPYVNCCNLLVYFVHMYRDFAQNGFSIVTNHRDDHFVYLKKNCLKTWFEKDRNNKLINLRSLVELGCTTSNYWLLHLTKVSTQLPWFAQIIEAPDNAREILAKRGFFKWISFTKRSSWSYQPSPKLSTRTYPALT